MNLKNKKTRRIILTLCVILLIGIVIACTRGGKKKGPGMVPGIGAGMQPGMTPGLDMSQKETVHSVKTEILERKDLQEYLSINGNIQANNTISVYPQIGGKITAVYVTLGSTVKRGDKIAEIDPSSPGTYYEASPVYAPISGTITALPLTVGTSVNTQTAIAQIGNIDELQIKARVPERDIASLKNGLSAEIILYAYKNTTFDAHVIRVSPIVDEVSRSKEIYLAFDKDDERINAGMYAKIKLNTILHKSVFVISYDAVQTIDGDNIIFIVNEDNTVSKRKVELGVNVDGFVEILSGVEDGEKVVVSGIQSLSDGAKIKEVNKNEGGSV